MLKTSHHNKNVAFPIITRIIEMIVNNILSQVKYFAGFFIKKEIMVLYIFSVLLISPVQNRCYYFHMRKQRFPHLQRDRW